MKFFEEKYENKIMKNILHILITTKSYSYRKNKEIILIDLLR